MNPDQDPLDKFGMINRTLLELKQEPHLLSPKTRQDYRYDLLHFQKFRGERPFRKRQVDSYLVHLQKDNIPIVNINHKLAAIRWSARLIVDILYEDVNIDPATRNQLISQMYRIIEIRDLKVPVTDQQPTRLLEEIEFRKLIAVCERDPSPSGIRDGSIFWLARDARLLRNQITKLEINCFTLINEDEMEGVIKGKGGKMRDFDLREEGVHWIHQWLKLRGNTPGPLFCPVNKYGQLRVGLEIGGVALRLILNKRILEAGIAAFTWHDLRRTL